MLHKYVGKGRRCVILDRYNNEKYIRNPHSVKNKLYLFLSLNLLGYRTLIFGVHENINLDPHNIRLKIIHQYEYGFISIYKYLRLKHSKGKIYNDEEIMV